MRQQWEYDLLFDQIVINFRHHSLKPVFSREQSTSGEWAEADALAEASAMLDVYLDGDEEIY